jgi:hypothetical protein
MSRQPDNQVCDKGDQKWNATVENNMLWVPVVWVRCDYWEDEVWEGECLWCMREFAYHDAKAERAS